MFNKPKRWLLPKKSKSRRNSCCACRVKALFSLVALAEDVQWHQPQPGQLDDQHDDDEAAGHSGAHPRNTGTDPELHSSHTGNGPAECLFLNIYFTFSMYGFFSRMLGLVHVDSWRKNKPASLTTWWNLSVTLKNLKSIFSEFYIWKLLVFCTCVRYTLHAKKSPSYLMAVTYPVTFDSTSEMANKY